MAKTNAAVVVTAMEAEALNLMAYDLYNPSNGQRPESFDDVVGGVWTWSVADCWRHPKRTFSGVMSSLVQKGLAWSQENTSRRGEPNDAAIGMTEAGYQAWLTVDTGRALTTTQEKRTPPAAPEPVREDDETRCKRVMATFPDVFGLRRFPGDKFMVGRSDSLGLNWSGRFSYQNDDEVMLYIANSKGQGFAKGTVAELRSQIVVDLAESLQKCTGAVSVTVTDGATKTVATAKKTFAVYADRVVVAKVVAANWLAAMELAQEKIGDSVTAVRLVRE